MRRDPDADRRPVVDDEVARLERAGDLQRVGHVDGNRAGQPPRIARRRRVEAVLVDERQQARREALRLLADPIDADLVDDVEAGERRVVRGNRRRPVHHAHRVAAREVVHRPGIERERGAMGDPPGEGRPDLRQHIGPRVEERVAGPAAQPFQAAADGEIGFEGGHVDGDDAGRLIRVEDDLRAHLVRARDDRGGVHDVRRPEQHVREGDDGGRAVDGVEHAVGAHRQIGLGGDDPQLVTGGLLRPVEIHHRGKIHLAADEHASRGSRIQARQRHQMRRRHVFVHADRPGRRADDARDLVADFERHLPPALFPGAHAARRPCLGVLGEILRRLPRHRAE